MVPLDVVEGDEEGGGDLIRNLSETSVLELFGLTIQNTFRPQV